MASTAAPDRTRADQAAERIAELVLGELEPGAPLPSEGTLAAELGVSRLTVREAISSLQARGLVEVRRGRRPTAGRPSSRPLGDYFTAVLRRDPGQLLDLLELRQGLEVHIASLAARRAGPAALAALEHALAQLRPADPAEPDLAAVNAADLRFHETLAAATGNELLAQLMAAMAGPLAASRLSSLRGHLARGGTVADVVAQHEAVLDRVRAGDAAGAAAAMREHLDRTGQDLRTAFTFPDAAAPPPTAPPDREET